MPKQQREQQSDWQEDAITEPPNSTVDDWLGQQVARDEERADKALEDAGGDLEEAEREYNSQTADSTDEPVPTGLSGFGQSNIPDPMPDELAQEPDQTESVDAMKGESPTG